MTDCTFTVRGARGGRTVVGEAFCRYGSHTTCFSLETPDGILIVDAGTGIHSLAKAFRAADTTKPMALFFTHFHLDHLVGLPGFSPLYQAGSTLRLYGASPSQAHPWPDLLTQLLDEPYWPVPLRKTPSSVTYHDLDSLPGPVQLFGAEIRWCELTHTQRCLGYRIAVPNHQLVILTDHESQLHVGPDLVSFAAGADTLIVDAQYCPEEYVTHRGWGHGTWGDATTLAQQTGAKHLLLTHHDPARTDSEIDAIQHQARLEFPATDAAREAMTLNL